MSALGGLNEPHVMAGGKIAAQAYDNAAFKVAADDLVLGSGAQLLFHATKAWKPPAPTSGATWHEPHCIQPNRRPA